MEMKKKGTKHRSKAEKLKILKEAETHGRKATLEKYDVYPATFDYWRRKHNEMGAEGVDHGMTKERLARIKKLESENLLLKQLLAEKDLESRLKDDLLKKKYPHLKKWR